MNQKDGVFKAICEVLGETSFNERVSLTSEQRSKVLEFVSFAIMDGQVEMKAESRAKHNTEDKMRVYTRGLITNWLNKDKRLNGNVDHKAKNPGSRAGQKIPEVIELRKLLKQQQGNPEVCAAIEAKIAEFIAANKPEKAVIDWDLIPEEFRSKKSS